MILNALCSYYDELLKLGEVPPFGYEKVGASYELVLDEDSNIVNLTEFSDDSDGKSKKRNFIMPTRGKSSKIKAALVCDNAGYIFGLSGSLDKQKTEEKKFEAAKSFHLQILKDCHSKEAEAIKNYFRKWDINKAWEEEHILSAVRSKGDALPGNIVIRLVGESNYFHENAEIVNVWLEENKRENEDKEKRISQCGITGEISEIALLHEQFQGIKGANATGTSLVCFNKDSDLSYGLNQSFNSNVSVEASFKYAQALKYLLSSREQKMVLGEDTIVFWSEKKDCDNEAIYARSFRHNSEENEENMTKKDKNIENAVNIILKEGRNGLYNKSMPDINIDLKSKFYILGLSPNAGRVSVRYFLFNTFGFFMDVLKQHYDDVSIKGSKLDEGKPMSIHRLLYAIKNQNASNSKVNPLLAGALMRSIMTGSNYPVGLYNEVISRVKNEKNITQARAAIIKGYLNRKNRKLKKEEELKVEINEEKTGAYMLGRLFAVLENIQKTALGTNLNSTVKDRYFTSASTTPALVFPAMLRLAEKHLKKIKKGNTPELGGYLEKLMNNLAANAGGYPKALDIEDQGYFMDGYYQQKVFRPTKSKNTTEEEIIKIIDEME